MMRLMAMICLLSAPAAQGGEVIFGIGNGVELNQPFTHSFFSPELTIDYRPLSFLGVTSTFAYRPSVGRKDWSSTMHHVYDSLYIAPTISPVRFDGRIGARAVPIHTRIGENTLVNVGFGVGMGAVYTEEDLAFIQAEGNSLAESTANEWHLSLFYSVSGEVRWGRYGIRLRTDHVRHTEMVFGRSTMKAKRHLMSLDFIVAFGKANDPTDQIRR